MTRHSINVIALSLGACAAVQEPAPRPAATLPAPLVSAVKVTELDVAALLEAPPPVAPSQVRHVPSGSKAQDIRRPPIARVDAANRAALREPTGNDYLNAVQVYAWAPGALYRLYTAPGQVSDIALEPGEALVSVAAGDTARWVIGDTTSGSGSTLRTHILVKPAASGLETNLVIATDRRVYHVQVESNLRTAMAGISWSYPEAIIALTGAGASTAPVAVPLAASGHVYEIKGDRPPWRPLRAFDDGRQVFIEFPADLAQGEAPPLFVTGDKGRTGLVNYRIRGRYYIVDQLFTAAELRLGEGRQQIVRIVRIAAPGKRGRGRAS